MRTRSQPISPSGFQSLETAPRRKKAQTATTAAKTTKTTKTTKVAKSTKEIGAKVEKKKPGKRSPKKTSKKPTSKADEIPNNADNSNDTPAPNPNDDTSVKGAQRDVNDVETNQKPLEKPTTDKCEQPTFPSPSPLTVPTPMHACPVPMDTGIPSSISSQHVGSQDEHKQPPSAGSLPRPTASTSPVRFGSRRPGSSITQTNGTTCVSYESSRIDNCREWSSSGTGKLSAITASSAPALSTCHSRHPCLSVSLSIPSPSRSILRTSTSCSDTLNLQRVSQPGNDPFSSHSQPRVSRSQQAGLGANFPCDSETSRSSPLTISPLGLENHFTSHYLSPPPARCAGSLLRRPGSDSHPGDSRPLCQNSPTSRDRAAHSIPDPCHSPSPSDQLNYGSSAHYGHSYHSPVFTPFEPFPRNRVYRSWESQAASRASTTPPDSSGSSLPSSALPRSTSTGTQTLPTLASGTVPPTCTCCYATLICPTNKHHINPFLGLTHPNKPTTLTTVPASSSRKRPRRDSSDDDDLRSSKKRRDVGTSSIARHRQRRVTPYAERSRRRAVESQGRIDKTLFRIPQLIAQNKADRDTTNKAGDADVDEPAWDVLNQMRADAAELSDQERPRTPPAPETPTRTWGIRGLLNSVPRSLSKLIPTFGLSPARTESSTGVLSTPRDVARGPAPSTPPTSTSNQGEESEQPEQSQDFEHLTYSLFPQPLDRLQLLGTSPDVPYPRKGVCKALEPEANPTKQTESNKMQPATNNIHSNIANSNNHTHDSSKNPRKRKHYIPEPIPNPPGTSYGMDLRYFVDSSLSEPDDDSLPEGIAVLDTEHGSTPISVREQAAIRGILRGPKRVRFDASPENTPSKLRLRDPGPQNIDDDHHITKRQNSPLSKMAYPTDISSKHSSGETSTPTPPANAQCTTSESLMDPQPRPPSPPIIRPNPFGTYCLDYDMFSDDDDSYEEELETEQVAASSGAAITASQVKVSSSQADGLAISSSQQKPLATHERAESRSGSQALTLSPEAAPVGSQTPQPAAVANNWTQPPPPRPTPAHASLPSQPTTPIDADAVAKLRSQAEKYKPKLPSGLRASRRYSSSPVSAPDSGDNMASQSERFEPLLDSPLPHLNAREPCQAMEVKGKASIAGKENLPGYPEGLREQSSYVPNPQIRQLVRDMWMEDDDEAADEVFRRELQRFRQEQSLLEWPEPEEGEGEIVEEEEEGSHIESFNLGSYDEFSQRLGEYRRRQAA
ncbi:hypothetical protein ACJ72_04220 [Emergomyces africanus]|uniref:Uncharacterized protein n=1 Tax=Emergomyces africanus TaxID=1955775 RepID=A0A1B7NXC4_9EURO|nr:hypothetical protein ACJ72_04220 [Emergomyces africanus]